MARLYRIACVYDGVVADYIPELALADPDWFGICIATHDGHVYVYEVGDTGQAFAIQSISKPLTYGLALEQNGETAVLAKVGVEPSGEAFNAIGLEPHTGKPMNPLVNAGAIAACGLIAGDTSAQKIAGIRETLSRYAGRTLESDERLRLYHLHGALVFSSVEQVIRTLMARADGTELFILNLKLVQGINRSVARLLADTQTALRKRAPQLVFTEAGM